MWETTIDPELTRLLDDYRGRGGAIDHVFLRGAKNGVPEALHRSAALEGMAVIDRRLERWANEHASDQTPVDRFFRVTWDATRLVGHPVTYEVFRGAEDVVPTPIGRDAWSMPERDGYRPAFFHPPYNLRGTWQENEQLYASIAYWVLGSDPSRCEIFAWSTDWSNYFDAGHEWWGAFYWTIRQPGSDVFTVIGASTPD